MSRPRNYTRYELRDGHKVVYRGITGRPLEERIEEHKSEGKRFSSGTPVGPKVTRETARDWEKESLKAYRDNHRGRNPRYNDDKDG